MKKTHLFESVVEIVSQYISDCTNAQLLFFVELAVQETLNVFQRENLGSLGTQITLNFRKMVSVDFLSTHLLFYLNVFIFDFYLSFYPLDRSNYFMLTFS